MGDLDRRLRAALDEHAERAPGDESLLAGVHARSRRLRRRRAAAGAATVVGVFALGVPSAIWAIGDGGSPATPAATVSARSVESSPGWVSASPPPSSPASPGTDHVPSPSGGSSPPRRPVDPVMPLRLPPSIAEAFEPPVVSRRDGAVVAYYEAKDPVGGADVTVVVTPERPVFEAETAQVTQVERRVRATRGTLRAVAVRPAAKLILYWREAETQWVQIRTDDTFTASQVVGFADALVPEPSPLD